MCVQKKDWERKKESKSSKDSKTFFDSSKKSINTKKFDYSGKVKFGKYDAVGDERYINY